MLIARSADWHVRSSDLPAFIAQANALVEACVDRGVSLLTISGDLFDKSTIHDSGGSTGLLAEALIRVLSGLTEHGIQVVIVPGDHDIPGVGSMDALTVLDNRPGIHVFHSPGVYSHDNSVIAAVPWNWSGHQPAETIAKTVADARLHANGRPVMLVAHLSVFGMLLSRLRASERDEHPARARAWEVSREFIEALPVDYAALGDYHLRQEIAAGKRFQGALRQLGFHEEGNPAGFDILDTETGAAEWIELDAAPKHRTYSPTDEIQTDANEIQRVIYDGDKPDPVDVRRLEAAGVRVEQILERVERIARVAVPVGVMDDPRALIRLWGSVQMPPLTEVAVLGMTQEFDKIFGDATPIQS